VSLIDTHVHLIRRGELGYSWTEAIPELASGSFTTTDYFAIAGNAVSDAVYMEMAVDGDEGYKDEARLLGRYMLDGTERLSGVIASCRPESEAGFEVWIEECDGLGVSGFRRVLHEEPDDLSRSATYHANVRRIGELGLPYDLCYNASQLGIARELALACRDMPLVLNHCGVPRIAEGEIDNWRADMTALAEIENVFCKLSGLTAYCGPDQDPATAIAPYVDHVLDTFGPHRMVWGSDWPVVNLGEGLDGWIAISQSILGRLTESERTAISSGTARRIYRLVK